MLLRLFKVSGWSSPNLDLPLHGNTGADCTDCICAQEFRLEANNDHKANFKRNELFLCGKTLPEVILHQFPS